jgi:hypothetical protein
MAVGCIALTKLATATWGGGSGSHIISPSLNFDVPNIRAAFGYEPQQEPQLLWVSFDRQCCMDIVVTEIAESHAKSSATDSEIPGSAQTRNPIQS